MNTDADRRLEAEKAKPAEPGTAEAALQGVKALGRAIRAEEEPTTVLVTHPGQPIELSKGWSREQIELVKSTIGTAAGLTDDEFLLFVATAQRLQLDPIARQIHAVKRGGKLSIQVGIDGFRAIADRTGLCVGNSDPAFTTRKIQAGQEEGVPIEGELPVTATVTVLKLVAGEPRAFPATARWAEYYPGAGGSGFMWRKMPYLMLGKCAEGLALRKAFPAELGGVYVPEEMHQAEQGQVPQPPENGREESTWTPPTGSSEQLRKIAAGVEIPIRNKGTIGRPLGDLSQEHVDRLAKWCQARDDDFQVKYSRFMWAIDQIRTKTDDELEAARVDREEPERKPGEEPEPDEGPVDEGGYQ